MTQFYLAYFSVIAHSMGSSVPAAATKNTFLERTIESADNSLGITDK